MTESSSNSETSPHPETIAMPRPTAWPMVLAAGVGLLALGIPTNMIFSLVGLGIIITSLYGWFGQLLTEEAEVEEPLVAPELRAKPIKPSHKRVLAATPGQRLELPEKVHPYSAGIKGGLAGGAVMAVVASMYGLFSGRGFWYPINLLAAMILPDFADNTIAELAQFSLAALIIGVVIHLATSLMVGLFFGVLLPTLPSSPVFWGGVVGPLLWSAFIYAFMGVLNPVMSQYVSWPWFIASQFAFGIVMGLVVVRSEKISAQSLTPATNRESHDG
ncbi:hypothetical protein LOC68_17715 [Blastopirellula sp. JC732]|uniref:Uncharacterized protein n=1 Tax=Blastopirellula sediminis TaxID=2894196 RepID=A0A9X1SGI7_9BACT|nr:hypothetical protein [Blastopirellula sediminis]MCC9606467.1 hypothetical protein [Blastopirellula sediminis]MCC9630235.1 hypothetical protein [Blastopirellula sediminis]